MNRIPTLELVLRCAVAWGVGRFAGAELFSPAYTAPVRWLRPGRPDPRRDPILSLAFAQQRGNAVMLRQASARRLRSRAGGRHATGARA
eukprot:COSAG04_NODE_1185_length_7876_cov_15.856629_5_plen_89_part_00